jgi:nicotinamidase-related amidase
MSTHAAPETLIRIAGLSTLPGAPQESVLVMIDPQREYQGRLRLTGIADAVEEGARLLAFARSAGIPVFHVLHHGRQGSPLFDPASDGAKFIDELAPLEHESVLTKSLPNAFAGTELAQRIRASGRRLIIIAGFATHMCVSATARAALDLGFRSTVVAGATATRDLPNPLGEGVTTAATLQQGTLAALSDRFSVVVQDTAVLVERARHAAKVE